MGGGGGYGFSADDLNSLDKKAKEKIADNETIKRNIFISFDNDDLDEVNLFRGQAKNESSELSFSDYSIKIPFNSDKAEYIKRMISEKIKQCSTCLLYLTNDSVNSKWVKWEIEKSKELGKSVIGYYKTDSGVPSMSPDLRSNIDKIVPWNHKAISSVIEDLNG